MKKLRLDTELTERQKKFCKAYIACGVGGKAVRKAGYSANGADVYAHHLLRNTKIQAEIQRLRLNLGEALDLSPEKILMELKQIGFSNIKDFHQSFNELKDFDSIPKNKFAAISEISSTTDSIGEMTTRKNVKIRMHDKLSAIVQITKMLGYDKVTQEEKPLQPLFPDEVPENDCD